MSCVCIEGESAQYLLYFCPLADRLRWQASKVTNVCQLDVCTRHQRVPEEKHLEKKKNSFPSPEPLDPSSRVAYFVVSTASRETSVCGVTSGLLCTRSVGAHNTAHMTSRRNSKSLRYALLGVI